ncbi:MAG: SMI1/KNR4 family protein [Peptococcaceae bacterium]|nr:SMI1/KNR4 family protein [Peptococcaceae bacterium]
MLNQSIIEKLNTIEDIEKKYGQSIMKKTNDNDYVDFENWLTIKGFSNSSLDFKEYIDLLANYNGINFNGLFLYSISQEDEHSIYEENDILWENEDQKKYIFFGDDSISWYCVSIRDMTYHILDKPSGTVMQSFNSFFDMFDKALEAVIP